MRVITGSARGRNLKTLEGLSVRPTSQKVKEAMFSAIQFYIEGASVLDLFAGSGQLGIEAMSRGARDCTFVDLAKESCAVVRENLRATGFDSAARVVMGDAVRYLESAGSGYDIIFADPPYRLDAGPKLLERVSGALRDGGLFLLETEEEAGLPESAGSVLLFRRYRYGKTAVRIYKKAGEPA